MHGWTWKKKQNFSGISFLLSYFGPILDNFFPKIIYKSIFMSKVLKVFDAVSAFLERMQYLEAHPDVSYLTSSYSSVVPL